ncbi:MAG TPA: hypothetical protein VFV37_08450 [Luteibaculaceae bacterium]|nr:hypothetical protein [Luteibaculaceae bacterium]
MLKLIPVILFVSLSISSAAQRIPMDANSRPPKNSASGKEGGKSTDKSKSATVQNGTNQYHDLLMMYLDGDLDKCLKKSLKTIEDEKTSKDPLPYVYAAMCYLDFWNDEEARKDYPEGLKDALKMAARYRKKDERNSQKQGLDYLEFWDGNKEFFAKLRQNTKAEAQKMLDEGKPAKAEGWYKLITAFDEGDYSSYYALYTLRSAAGDTAQANANYRAFKTSMEKVKDDLAYEPDDRLQLLKYAAMEHAKFLIRENRTPLAKETVDEIMAYLKKDAELSNFVQANNLR